MPHRIRMTAPHLHLSVVAHINSTQRRPCPGFFHQIYDDLFVPRARISARTLCRCAVFIVRFFSFLPRIARLILFALP